MVPARKGRCAPWLPSRWVGLTLMAAGAFVLHPHALAGLAAAGATVRHFGFKMERATPELLREVAPFADFATVSPLREEFADLVMEAERYDLEVVVELDAVFFRRRHRDGVPDTVRQLRSDYRARWEQLVARNLEVLDPSRVFAFFLIDEPFWSLVPVMELRQASAVVAATYPLIPILTSLGHEDLVRLPDEPLGGIFDIIGYHRYAVSGPLAEDEVFREDLARLQTAFPGQPSMIVADAWWSEGRHGSAGLSQEGMGSRGREYLAVAEDVGAEVLGAFEWDSFPEGLGLRQLPLAAVREYERIGAEVTDRCGVPAAVDPLDGGTVLFLHGCRFWIRTFWIDPTSGALRRAWARPLEGDSGTFFFFDPGNLEVSVKVLDGRLVNGFWWVFWSHLTDLDVRLEVHDADTGEWREYRSPAQDVTAFAAAP